MLQEVCTHYWPHTGVVSYDYMSVELTGGKSFKDFTTRTLKVTDNKVG